MDSNVLLADLELPWKPLHELVEVCLYNKYETHGLVLIPKNLENILKNAVRTCRPYFPVSSTREMLDEFRPLLCPFDVSITVSDAMRLFDGSTHFVYINLTLLRNVK